MTDLLSELSRSPILGDREVADLLRSMRPAPSARPRASEALASYIAEGGSGMTRPVDRAEQADSGLLVVLAPAPEPGRSRRRKVLSGGFVRSLVPPGVWGKVVVAATAALAAGVVVSGGPSPAVDVRPADTDATVAPALSTPPVPDPDPTPQRRAVSPQPFSRPREAVSTTIADGTTSRAGTHTRGSDERGRESEQPVQPTETDDPEADGTSGSPAEGGLEGGSSSADGASTSAGDGSDDTGSGDPTGSNSGSDDGAAATSAQASDD